MLVIRRRAGQSVVLGGNIEIEVVEVSANGVKLGIIAPKEVPVVRKEIQLTGETNHAAARQLGRETLTALLERFHHGGETKIP